LSFFVLRGIADRREILHHHRKFYNRSKKLGALIKKIWKPKHAQFGAISGDFKFDSECQPNGDFSHVCEKNQLNLTFFFFFFSNNAQFFSELSNVVRSLRLV